ncbi:MAG TPA: c-type cytochrome [Luteimonas sp.]|nr:c-type cytochrome [Luteimonas sp.]HRP71699.1 c-type cytochrome [Luteimonas sp.]
MNTANPVAAPSKRKPRWLWWLLLALLVLGAVVGFAAWYKFFREEPQPDWVTATPEMRFRYGSIGAENEAGIPYWIFYVLPRMFPEKLPGPGGYAAFGVAWEQGQELPVGFTKKVVGFPRVANTCATCHTASYRTSVDGEPTYVVGGPGHTLHLSAFFRFLVDAAKDPRFNADNIMREINLVTELSWLDRLIYRYALIPITRKRLMEREPQFEWIYRDDFPDWGRGRDDGMNLTKYFMLELPMDDSLGATDMPSVWNLKKYDRPGTTMNFAGDSHDAYSVIIDSALGLMNAAPKSNEDFLGHVRWMQEYLSELPPPKYPFPVDAALAAAGESVFTRDCAACHASAITGTRQPLAGIDTDRARIDAWNAQHAIAANRVVTEFGIERKGLVEEDLIGYNPPFLDGLWLRAPYLHNGSVPTLRDLLRPPAERPSTFWRGYDLYDPVNVGFVTSGEDAERIGTFHDTAQLNNGNGGHVFGTTLPEQEKAALLEYLKTL